MTLASATQTAPEWPTSSIVDALASHIAILDEGGQIVSVNDAWLWYSVGSDDPLTKLGRGDNFFDVCFQLTRDGLNYAARLCEDLLLLTNGQRQTIRMEMRIGEANSTKWFSFTASRIDEGVTQRYVLAYDDITSRRVVEERMRYESSHDHLTGLANRAHLMERLERAVIRKRDDTTEDFGLLFLDFDRFKFINDSLGHEFGDLLLCEITRRLKSVVSVGTVARLGGDEFVVLLERIGVASEAEEIAEELLNVLSTPYQLRHHEVHSTASIGVVTSCAGAWNAADVLRDADMAMYEAKLAGKARYVVFDQSMRQRIEDRHNLESDLRKAIEEGQLFLMYQPIVSLSTGLVESFEALVRWRHPRRGIVQPSEFIPVAEEIGLIEPMGEWILRKACIQLAAWKLEGGPAAPKGVSVNLSRHQLMRNDIDQTIRQVLEDTGLDPECLHLEVTESTVMKDVAAARRTLKKIKAIGVRLDMDDFGTGHSSLSCLHQFPFDVLKIDRSFISNIDRGRDFAALVQAMADLARNLNMQIVAEGVERAEQSLVLQALNCDYGQGYYFSKPLMPRQAQSFAFHAELPEACRLSA